MSMSSTPLTLVYSKIDDLEIKLDLYLPPQATGRLPAIVIFHGGGLTIAHRAVDDAIPVWMIGMYAPRGVPKFRPLQY